MKSLRILLGDRVSAGLVAATTGWLLVLQLFVAAFTCGMTLQASAAADFTLCLPGVAASQEDGRADTAGFSHDCPYVIGHDDDGLLAADQTPGADLGPAFEATEPALFTAFAKAARPIDPGRLGLAPAPRGPPLLSA